MGNVVDCQPTQTAAISHRVGLLGNATKFRLFDQPIPYRGRQGVFDFPTTHSPAASPPSARRSSWSRSRFADFAEDSMHDAG
jgi:hypothetical protein